MKLLPVMLVTMVAMAARADDANRFGDAGVLVPSGSISFSRQQVQTLHSTDLIVQPNVQYFVIPHLALGLGVTYGRSWFSPGAASVYGLQPSVGYDVPLLDGVSLFPRAFFSFTHLTGSGPDANIVTSGIFAPVLFHAARHFFLGIGPSATAAGRFSDPFEAKGLALQTVIGGWL